MRLECGQFLLSVLIATTVLSTATLAADSNPPKTVGTERQRYQKDGITIDFSLKSVDQSSGFTAGGNAIATFQVSDTQQKRPLTGLRPRAWFAARLSEMVSSETTCSDKIRTLVGGGLTAKADIDLNSYLLLMLNHDKTVSFINPQVAFKSTKMESIVELPSVGADWVQSPDKHFVYISMPDQSAVAVINTLSRRLLTTISTGSNTKPTRVVMQPDGRIVWVGLDDSTSVAAIDIATNKFAATIAVGNGLHNLVPTSDSRFVYVSNSKDDTISAIDTQTLTKVADIKVGKTPMAMAYGNASQLVYVAALNGEKISAIDPQTQKIAADIPAQKGIMALRFEPKGRFAFAVNQIDSTVSVLDSATNKLIATTAVVKEPDQVIFTDNYAYIRGLGSEKFSLIDLDNARKGSLQPVDIQAGRLAPETEADQIGIAPMMVATPDGNSVMIANAPDRMTYFYQEGMMAPMGTLSNYKRLPRGVMIIDQSLTESAPGIYTAAVRLPHAGRFDVPVLLDQPRVIHCFQVSVTENPNQPKVPLKEAIEINRVPDDAPIIPHHLHTLRFRITDPLTHQAITGLGVSTLAFRVPGTWQKRNTLKETGEGVYEWQAIFPEPGVYKILFNVPSRKIRWVDSPAQALTVIAKPDDQTVTESNGLGKMRATDEQ
ncbi:MAG: YncE family protein [Methylococcaceae bacterium]|nr:YncE family protein [Methylococcaceae bacterium]